ncbi:MAG: EAL domain-containing protein, partial [Cyanobacteria bacterium J06555_12]
WACSQVVSDFEKVFSKFPDFYVSINLSPVQINFDRMKTTVNTIIEAPGELQNSIVFEVVEGTLIDEEKTISPDTIARLRRMGFNVALDDFGTGYSSIRYLQKFEFDYLKIDRLFVGSIGREDRTGILVDTIIGIGQKLNLTLVAEGIETEEQRQALLQRGVCFGQGWLYSRALPLDEFEQYIQVSNPS